VKRFTWLAGLVILVAAPLKASVKAPHIFFSDLAGGPNVGGENGLGVFVTIFGTNFGVSREGSGIRVGGQPVAAYRLWSDTRIVFQPGGRVVSGGVQVQTREGLSNAVPFEVRPGKVYFVANTGKDGSPGSYSAPWRSLPYAVQTIQAGDVIYALDGVSQLTDDGQGWDASLTLRSQWCGAGAPRALVAYPGATVTIGADIAGSPNNGLRSTDFSADGGACAGNWVFAGLQFRGLNPVVLNGPSTSWRLVANDISCPHATGSDGGGACFETTLASNIEFYGNEVHDAGAADASALFQGVYFSTDSNHIDMGWNTVANVHGCRGIQVHSSPLGSGYPNSGYNQFDILIHDNLIHDTQCDGIILDTIDPSKGAVWLYNNIIYNAGKGPQNPENTGGWSCIYVPATTESGAAGSGTVEIFNNTLYNCGAFQSPPYGDANAAIVGGSLTVRIRNNLVYQIPSENFPRGVPYVVVWDTSVPNGGRVCADNESCSGIQGSNNLFFGSNQVITSSWITATILSDPLLTAPAAGDFHLQQFSPASHAGCDVPVRWNYDGQPLELTAGHDIGALGVETVSAVPEHRFSLRR
jgi:hypothetical protein